MSMDIADVPKVSHQRIERVMALRKCNLEDAINYCISVGWYMAERKELDKEQNITTEMGRLVTEFIEPH